MLLPVKTYEQLVNDADKESRSVSSQGSLIIQKYYEDVEDKS
ncbi:MAG: ribbon-helix-helix domain-containing protein [Dolichospermum sp.]